MSSKSISAAVEKALQDIAKKVGTKYVDVGFLAGAKYSDGTPVAQVAFWNEFGHAGEHPSPPRPFFRNCIGAHGGEWPGELGRAVKAANGDGAKALAVMGEAIAGEIQESITSLTSPALAASTIQRKGFNKPLIDTGQMLRSVDFEVK